jgi:hypothetical protein
MKARMPWVSEHSKEDEDGEIKIQNEGKKKDRPKK